MNTIEFKNVLLKDFLVAHFNGDDNLFNKISDYYKNNLEDVNDIKYYVDLIRKNLNSQVNVEVSWDNNINYQYLVNFNYPTSDFLVFNNKKLWMIVYLYDFLRYYFYDFKNINELKDSLDDIGVNQDEINLILMNLGKKVQININDLRQYYENDVIIGKNQHIYFDSIDIFKNI